MRRHKPNRQQRREIKMHMLNMTSTKTAPLVKRLDGAFVVKVQRSIVGTGPVECLLYNSDRSVLYQTDDESLLFLMGPSLKMYFWAKLGPDGKINILEEAPWQEW